MRKNWESWKEPVCFSETIKFHVHKSENKIKEFRSKHSLNHCLTGCSVTRVSTKKYHLHERLFQIVFKDHNTFEYLLKRDKLCAIHQRNIQSLAIELFKTKGNLPENIMYDIFHAKKID